MLSPTTQLRNEAPITYYVFDVLTLDGKSTTELPYLRRRTELDDLALSGPRPQVPPYWTDVDGEQMLDLARRHHREGAVAQRVHSTYQPGRRSPAWIKQPLRANTEGIIVGWVDGTGAAPDGIGSLLLAAYDDNHRLVYIGHLGTGFTTATRKSLRGQVAAIERPTTPLDSHHGRTPRPAPSLGRTRPLAHQIRSPALRHDKPVGPHHPHRRQRHRRTRLDPHHRPHHHAPAARPRPRPRPRRPHHCRPQRHPLPHPTSVRRAATPGGTPPVARKIRHRRNSSTPAASPTPPPGGPGNPPRSQTPRPRTRSVHRGMHDAGLRSE
ncbi:DNA-ligase (ATP), C-terminal [Rhodococcus opacus]|uniref:DNA ligase (ATP) n=1 Tax=Rhodococcus opacus TaxID=37919 RepID=A0A1B1K850_RHOOP|nr:hypothetical protein [Rhodococcus opacus]ANS28802.1 DNA-ligase (ATP), C-terminal [Rhodococcus opacus]